MENKILYVQRDPQTGQVLQQQADPGPDGEQDPLRATGPPNRTSATAAN